LISRTCKGLHSAVINIQYQYKAVLILILNSSSILTVIFLDWSGVDLSSNPLHPAYKLFKSRSSMELQCIYILNIERLDVSVVL